MILQLKEISLHGAKCPQFVFVDVLVPNKGRSNNALP